MRNDKIIFNASKSIKSDLFGGNAELSNNDIEFKNSGINLYQEYDGIDIEEVELKVSNTDIMEVILNIVAKNRSVLANAKKNQFQFFQFLAEKISEVYDTEFTSGELINFKYIPEFVWLLSTGVIVNHKIINVVNSTVKFYYLLPSDQNNVYIKQTNMGKMYKSIPVISQFSESVINSTVEKFFKDKFPDFITDYYKYLTEKMQEEEISRKIEDINFFKLMNVEQLVSYIRENDCSKEMLLEKGVEETKINKALSIVSILNE